MEYHLQRIYIGQNNCRGQKHVVGLDKIRPWMEMHLVKITEGVPGKEGAVIYHEFESQQWADCHISSTWSTEPFFHSCFFFAIKKTKAEIAAQRVWHATRKFLRKEHCEEQDRNVQCKRALAGKTKADAVSATDKKGTDDSSSEVPSKEADSGEVS
jgi:ribosome biogenesis protein SSF1/2